ncbi:MAG TPA: hypothetical protein VFV95_17280 [Vicinamibacterales bacterium]|nr:hypothetical protein [Vicinamibacterales bacterium]
MAVLEYTATPDVTQWAGLIEAEYRELPGLNLTRRQIQRIWGLDESACDSVMRSLVTRRILCETDAGTFVACEPGPIQLSSPWPGREYMH